MAHEIKKLYTEKTPGGILPDSHVIVCSCETWKEKSTSKDKIMDLFELHQQYPDRKARCF